MIIHNTAPLAGGNGGHSFNIKRFYQQSDGSNWTRPFQAAHDEALGINGEVFIPAGTYDFDTLSWNPAVGVVGENWLGSVLRARTSGVPLINQSTLSFNETPGFKNLLISGQNLAPICFDLNIINHFLFLSLYIQNFTDAIVHTSGALIGTWQNVYFVNTPTGYRARIAPEHGGVQTNLVTFEQCKYYGNTLWGIDYESGSGVHLNSVNVENSGTNGNVNTGGIKYTSNGTDGNGITLKNCWAESNYGGSVLDIRGNVNRQINHSLRDCLFHNYNATVPVAVKISGSNHVLVDNCTFREYTNDIVVDGPNAKVIRLAGSLDAVSQLNGALYDVISGSNTAPVPAATGDTEENHADRTHVGTWGTDSASVEAYSGGTARFNSTAGEYFEQVGVGTKVDIYMSQGPNRGGFEVFINGVSSGTFTAYHATNNANALVATVTAPSGTNTIRVVNLSTNVIFSDKVTFSIPT